MSRIQRACIAGAFIVILACGCGGSKPKAEEYAPKIYAVEQEEKAAGALREGNLAEAIAAADRAINYDPNYPAPYVSKATALGRQGKREEAREVLNAVLEQRPDFAEGFLFRGVVNDELGASDAARADYEAASKAYAKLIEERRDDPEKELRYAVTEYLRAGTPGLRLINALTAKYPDNIPARFVRERMEAQDRAFAFRWITGQQTGENAAPK